MMMKKTVIAMSVLAMGAVAAQAAVIASHYGNTDPTTEGFSLNEWGGGLTASWGHGTDPAWVLQDNNTSGGGNMETSISTADKTAMSANGWKFTLDAKSQWTTLNSAAMTQFTTAEGTFQLKLGKVAGEQVVQVYNYSGGWNLVGSVTNSVDNYHKTELVYDGNSSNFVDVFFDGAEVFSDVTSADVSGVMYFGSGSGADIGEGRYREVTLETIPEPAATGMLMLGSALVLLFRRIRM